MIVYISNVVKMWHVHKKKYYIHGTENETFFVQIVVIVMCPS